MPIIATKAPRTLQKRVQAAAKHRCKTVSAFVRDAVEKEIAKTLPTRTFAEKYPELLQHGAFSGPRDLSSREGFAAKRDR